MGNPYYLRRELRQQTTYCVAPNCLMPPTRWSCLCQCHYMRWYLGGTFETLAERELRRAA